MFAALLGIALAIAPTAPLTLPADTPPPPTLEEVFAIPPELRQALQERVIAGGKGSERQRVARLAQFLFSPDGLGMRYRADADFTVAEAWQTREANCLTYTILTIALARAAGIEAYGQEINRTLTWYAEGDTLYFSNHVNAGVFADSHRYSLDVASDSVLIGELPKRIPDSRLLAILYTNRAVGLMTRGELAPAATYMSAAQKIDQRYPAAWNNAGVLALRQGDAQQAERHFLHTLTLDKSHDGALMNLAALYAGRGDIRKERQIRERIANAQQRNPFHYFMLASEDEKQGKYGQAAQKYRRAIQLYEGEHRFHFGLARAYLHLGENRKAADALRLAQKFAHRSAATLYQAKLEQLSRQGVLP